MTFYRTKKGALINLSRVTYISAAAKVGDPVFVFCGSFRDEDCVSISSEEVEAMEAIILRWGTIDTYEDGMAHKRAAEAAMAKLDEEMSSSASKIDENISL